MDYIEQGKLSVAGVKFFVLDEADRLLDTGNQAKNLNTSLSAMKRAYVQALHRRC